jgi:hypothetical protein
MIYAQGAGTLSTYIDGLFSESVVVTQTEALDLTTNAIQVGAKVTDQTEGCVQLHTKNLGFYSRALTANEIFNAHGAT